MKNKTIVLDINQQNVFFTSDPHFCHKNIIEYCNRPFDDVDEMNSVLIENWNQTVTEDDVVFLAGDFCFSGIKTRITVDHYPLVSWYQSHRGSFQLHGHVHGGLMNSDKLTPNQLDIGVDVHNFTPLSYEDVKKIITKQNLNSGNH